MRLYGRVVDPLFAGEPQPLPVRSGSTWHITVDAPTAPPEVRHAEGYEPFLLLAANFGTQPRDLFDLWRFAHFIRAHAAAFAADPDLQHAAVVFVGNVLASEHDLVWRHDPRGLLVETVEPWWIEIDDETVNNPLHRRASVERIVEALLEADEQRFYEFHPTAAQWGMPEGR